MKVTFHFDTENDDGPDIEMCFKAREAYLAIYKIINMGHDEKTADEINAILYGLGINVDILP